MSFKRILPLTLLALLLTACGTLTGIPSHGGGKRFAVEQELVTASARAAAKDMDLHHLQGRRVALYVSTMGDQGSGTITGGRYSVSALLRGEYTNIPDTLTSYAYPNYTTTATTTADTLSSNTQSTSVLNAPSHVRSKTGGASSTSNIRSQHQRARRLPQRNPDYQSPRHHLSQQPYSNPLLSTRHRNHPRPICRHHHVYQHRRIWHHPQPHRAASLTTPKP